MIAKLLIANRGEIAVRIIRTARRLGVATVAVYSDADADAMHVAEADEAIRIGPAPAAESYLRGDAIIAAARETGATAIHPGYGFLSENPDFVEAVEKAGLVFVGPPASAIKAMGLKDAAKRLMEEAGVPVVPGYHGEEQDPGKLATIAEGVGYPVLIKARAGGGGKGMRRVDDPKQFADALASAKGEAKSSFGDDAVLIEKYVSAPRHIEVQVFADSLGSAVHLYERDCSLQRRHQKVIEEAPAPGMPLEMREAMGKAAVRAAEAVGYVGAGTVEFIADSSDGLRADRFYFMEMNTRLQVEHPVTEAVTGLDLVEWQLRVAGGEPLPLRQDQIQLKGWAFEARLYAEDPARGFLPQTGTLERLTLPAERARIDSGVREGDQITPFYDPMIAKVITHGPSRAAALTQLGAALDATRVAGSVTNLAFLRALTRHEGFAAGAVDTGLIDRDLATLTAEEPPAIEAFAAAAVAALGLDQPEGAEARDPFASKLGWRIWGDAHMHATLVHEEVARDALVLGHGDGRFTVTIEGESVGPFRVRRDEDGLRMIFADAALSLDALRTDSGVTLFHEGRIWRFETPDPLDVAAAGEAGGDRITAPMPGLVKALMTEAGATVEKGQTLAILEAMKMEHRLTAPRDGVIAEIAAAAGDQIDEGALLIALAPEEGSD